MGIDTGGTYTDGVVLELDSKKVVSKSKARTTKEDLTIGIFECLENLSLPNPEKIRIVALSTTLATNAIVEGKGCKVGAILIGHEPIRELPSSSLAVIGGGHDIYGRPLENLDIESLKGALKDFKGKVSAIAVSSYLSIRNPEHELRVKDIIQKELDLPVVCAHQLTTTLGFHERTVTAILNAKLIPIITDLIKSVRQVLSERGINIPIMVVKGDGSLMGEKVAIQKPIETILSGPAASIVGATFLTGEDDAIVLDMGGTTTDIALLKKGIPRINPEGATVGGWLTRVEAADVHTYGLGGDSHIQVNPKENKILLGPKRVWPLSYIVIKYPHILNELSWIKKTRKSVLYFQATDVFILLKDPSDIKNFDYETLSATELDILKILKRKPHTLLYLAEMLEKDPNFLPIENLENLGLITRGSVTPTDILHLRGDYTSYDIRGAREGVQILAKQLGLGEEDFVDRAYAKIVNNLSLTILQSLLNIEKRDLDITKDSGGLVFIDKILDRGNDHIFKCSVDIPYTLIGIGAPVNAYLPNVSKKLKVRLVIPRDTEVANAIGAATGKVIETAKILIRSNDDIGFTVYLPWERTKFYDLEKAAKYAIEVSKEWVKDNALKAGGEDIEIIVDREDIYSRTATLWEESLYIETIINVMAIGNPQWIKGN